MDKALKKLAIDEFAKLIEQNLPGFQPYSEKNRHLVPGERVWINETTFGDVSLFAIFSPEDKGRDQFTIELGWSRMRRFPQLGRRPSLAFKSDFESCYERAEAITRLSYLTGEKEWIDINKENVKAVMLEQINSLASIGIRFLSGVVGSNGKGWRQSCGTEAV
ncbi:MAG: hypothetical protein ACJ8GW_20540 [Massilia sp.]